MRLVWLISIFILALATSCNAVKETSKRQLETGIYKMQHQQNQHYYAVVEEDKILLHPLAKNKNDWLADTTRKPFIYFSSNTKATKRPVYLLAHSFDLDVLTILFKYRPYISGTPNQFNTNFNAAGFIGYRTDLYGISYDKDPLGLYKQRINHFAYSFGFFGGLGSTAMSQYVTNNMVAQEYDGVVITKGISGLLGLGNLTFGVALGIDHLMDKNHKVWIYQSKPWIGFGVGLNLN